KSADGAEKSFRVVDFIAALPDVFAEQRAVNVRGDAPLLREVAGGEAGRGHEHENGPVCEQKHGDYHGLLAPVGLEEDEGREEVADGDAVEHACKSHGREACEGVRREVVEREPGEERAERVDENRAADDLQIEVALTAAALGAAR